MAFPEAGLYLLLVLWGSLVAMDGTSCGQFMLSRPVVAATIAGLLAGDPVAGATMGVVLEAFHLMVLPVGAARYPEGGPPAVVAGGLFALSDRLPSSLLTALLFFLAWEWVAGESVRVLRQVNGRILGPLGATSPDARRLERRHLAAMAADLSRGTVLVAIGIPLLWLLLRWSGAVWSMDEDVAQTVIAAVVVGVVAGSLRLFGGRVRLFVAGILAGLLFLLAR